MAKKQAIKGEQGLWSARAKREAVLRLLRGEAIDALRRDAALSCSA
jgi:hypothetical protein